MFLLQHLNQTLVISEPPPETKAHPSGSFLSQSVCMITVLVVFVLLFCLVHSDGFYRGDKLINLKALADDALQKCGDK